MITKYSIFFGIEKPNIKKKNKEENKNQEIKNEEDKEENKEENKVLSKENVDIKEKFEYTDFNSRYSIRNLKGSFLSLHGKKYNCCPCSLSVYQLVDGQYLPLSNKDGEKISNIKVSQLYIIKRNILKCDDLIEDYYKAYFQKDKFDIFVELKKFQQDKQRLEKENLRLNQLIKVLTELNEKITKKGEENIKKSEDFYDVIVDIRSIKGIKEGWDIKWNEKGKNLYLKCKKDKCLRIGVIGHGNKGKSFLLSKISNTELISGTHIQTEGLSIKYHDSKYKPLILLDSAGLETPVLKKEIEKVDNKEIKNENVEKNINEIEEEIKENQQFKENAKDKLMTELFIQDFIIQNSDILLLVVGMLTYSEQLLINKIKFESKNKKRDSIIIVHNLQNFRKKEQVEYYIKNVLLKCATFHLNKNIMIDINKKDEKDENNNEESGEESEENNNQEEKEENKNKIKEIIKQKEINEIESGKPLHFYEVLYYDKDKKMTVYHLILANEDSDEVRFYNQYTYNFIEKLYSSITGIKQFDILEKIKEDFKSLVPTILNNKIGEIKWNDEEDMKNKKKIRLDLKEEISFKKCIIDELGFSFFKTGNFEPKYNYFKSDPNTLELRLEIPGNATCKAFCKVEKENTIIKIEGKKNKDAVPKEENDNIYNLREFSNFEVLIPLITEKYKIVGNKAKGKPEHKDGLWKFKFELEKEEEEKGGSDEEVNDN